MLDARTKQFLTLRQESLNIDPVVTSFIPVAVDTLRYDAYHQISIQHAR